MPIKLVPKQFDALVDRVRDALDRVRAQERAIMQLCVRDARMPRADFLRLFPGNEVDLTWVEGLAKARPSTPKPSASWWKTSSATSRS